MAIFRGLERLVRGFSNHRRIEIMYLLEHNSGLSVIDVAERLKINFRTASEHLRRLYLVGLVEKHSRSASVEHKLSDKGRLILKFLRTLE